MARVHHRILESVWNSGAPSFFDDLARGPRAQEVFSQNTNSHPAFGVVPKIKRNNALVNSVFAQRAGVMLKGDRVQETLSDPLHRPSQYILLKFREETSALGRDRARIRPAAPQQVTWKNSYWRAQRPPYRQPIGPFTQGQLPQQSILQRLNRWAQGGYTG